MRSPETKTLFQSNQQYFLDSEAYVDDLDRRFADCLRRFELTQSEARAIESVREDSSERRFSTDFRLSATALLEACKREQKPRVFAQMLRKLPLNEAAREELVDYATGELQLLIAGLWRTVAGKREGL